MKKYLFLLAWVQDSEGAGGDATLVNDQDDLLPEYKKGNEYVFAVRIQAPNEEVALAFGYSKAFFDNYTAHDTVSNCLEIDGVGVHDDPGTLLMVADCKEEV